MKKSIFALASVLAISGPSFAGETPSADEAEVYFINLNNGDAVQSPVLIQFGLSGMGIAPAGIDKPNTGHHHLLIDRPPLGQGEDGTEELDYALPADENHIHYGGGQTEATIELAPGAHTLQLVLGDRNHIPHAKPVTSQVITITVE
ncbi:DUF4399 domain-containing protein [Nitratireductor sp. XY-223]|uniref:DUF4399 domain-containing protein n=1 Tax=Nitratireductor sp. XY-223 TaxID=2561926 RepID=UPI0010A9C6B8|nr:DUF4399 domain-containing protein [Nitratireductor sp. XY-223]